MDAFYLTLPLLLEELQSLGYRFVRVDEMLGMEVEVMPRAPAAKPWRKKATGKGKRR
jgi:hypothetical protein